MNDPLPIDAPFEHRYVPGEDARFTASERQVLWLLYCGQGRTVRHGALWGSLYDDKPDEEQAEFAIVKVYISKIRRKLKRHRIVPDWGVGYRLEPLQPAAEQL